MIGYIDRSDEEDGRKGVPVHGLAYAAALVAIGFVGSLAETHSFFQLNVAGFKAKSALSAAIFKKALALKQPRGESTYN